MMYPLASLFAEFMLLGFLIAIQHMSVDAWMGSASGGIANAAKDGDKDTPANTNDTTTVDWNDDNKNRLKGLLCHEKITTSEIDVCLKSDGQCSDAFYGSALPYDTSGLCDPSQPGQTCCQVKGNPCGTVKDGDTNLCISIDLCSYLIGVTAQLTDKTKCEDSKICCQLPKSV